MQKYKIQAQKPQLNRKYWQHLIMTNLINQIVVGPIFQATIYFSLTLVNIHNLISFAYIPSFLELFIKVVLAMILYEIIFFYTHWALHHRLIYKYIHKLHHRYVTPFSIVTLYQHPVEYVLCDLVTTAVPYIALRMDMPSLIIFITFIQFSTVFEHCGYNLPFLLSPEVHDYHHAHFKECFSTNGLMDYLHGTCEGFLKSDRFERHKVLP
jgi:fatty acid hydroxylase domain-containing protein 2